MFLACGDNPFAQHAAKVGQNLEVVVMAGRVVKEDLRRVGELASSGPVNYSQG
jgi:hypothetical protein